MGPRPLADGLARPGAAAWQRNGHVHALWRVEPVLGLPMTHLAMAFAIAHRGVTSALLGPRTMDHLDDLLAGVDVTLTDDVLDRIDEIVPPGTDVGVRDEAAYLPRRSCARASAAESPTSARPPEGRAGAGVSRTG
jgi:hypothetical protein